MPDGGKRSPKRYVRTKAEYIRMLLPFVSKEKTRYYLNGIHVEPHGEKGILLVATDGHRMGIVHDETGEANGHWVNPVPRRVTQGLSKKLALEVSFIGDAIYVTDADAPLPIEEIGEHHHIVVGEKPIDGTFPEWRKVVPTKVPSTIKHDRCFNARDLGDFAKIGSSLFLYRANEHAPVIVRVSEAPEFLGLIMPMRGSRLDPLPDWLTADPAATPAAAE